ncbi:MAG: hypothetical protein WEC34_06355 [Acidimicrobiia bacterium]
MPPDPVVALASSLNGSPGAYAVLLGSGVSQGAGILTGWDIALDLVRRLAVAEGDEPPDDPVAWYSERHGEDVNYSNVLETLAPGTGDRQALLDPYFEPTEFEREQGLKAPSRAHRAIAELAAAGVVKIIATTNFDRLTERALQDAGVEPLVIATAADAASAPPLHSVRCVVIKVNGDRMSPNLKNTLSELTVYEPDLGALLGRVLSEYGLIVCGWSGDWDPALRAVIVEHQPAVYSSFWAHRGRPTAGGEEVIKARAAIPVAITDADSFFDAVVSKVFALRDLQDRQPSNSDIAVAEVKRYLPDPIHRVRLNDLIMGEVERVIDATSPALMPLDMPALDPSRYMERLHAIEAEVAQLAPMMATLAFYADEPRHDELIVSALERLTTHTIEHSGKVWLIHAQRYPALLVLYATGLAALAHRRVDPIAEVFARITLQDLGEPRVSIAYELAPSNVLDYDALRATDEFARRKTPASDLLSVAVREHVAPYIPNQETYDELFDDLEYLHGIATFDDTNGRWGHAGQFGWRHKYQFGDTRPDRIVAQHGRELVDAGMFQGSTERLEEMHAGYDEFVRRNYSHF